MKSSKHLLGIISSFLLLLSFSIVSPEPEPQTDMDMKHDSPNNYIVTGDLPDGEHEVRIRFQNVVFREVSITENSVNRKHKWALMLRQLAVGPDFLQLIYKVNSRTSAKKIRLVECEVINDWNSANEFRKKFYRQLERAGVNIPVMPQINHSEHEHDEDYSDVEDDDTVDDFDSTNNNNLDLSNLESNWDMEFDPEAKEPLHKDSIDLSEGLLDLRNVTVRVIRDDEIDADLKSALDVTLQKKLCRRLHRKLKRDIEHHRELVERVRNNSSRSKRDTHFGIIPGTLWCGFDKVATKRSAIGAHLGTDICCRQHDECPIMISAFTTQYGMFNYRANTLSHCICDERRSKRELSMRELSDAFRVPGTKWCGMGYSALEAKDLGGYMGADKCCRFHDLGCPFYIEAFTEKFGLYNYRFYTIMHCSCDERFRSCLKQTNTGAADFVGKLFFNIVQTKCFVLKPEAVCSKRSWWGKCLKTEYKKQAHLRDPLPY